MQTWRLPSFSPMPLTCLHLPALCCACAQVAGTSGKVKLDGGSDDEGVACAEYGTAIQEALGRERNAEVLSKLYVARSDVQYVVRNTALHIWKTIVVNTPRTLQEILPALMAEVISALADPGGWAALAAAARVLLLSAADELVCTCGSLKQLLRWCWHVMANLSFDCSSGCKLMQLLPLSLMPAATCPVRGVNVCTCVQGAVVF
jgi:hypothetical protein